jgi:hypothetical protein
MRGASAFSVCLLAAACGGDGAARQTPPEGEDGPWVVHLGEVVDGAGEGRADLDLVVDGQARVQIALDGAPRIVEVAVAGADVTAELDGAASGGWFRPRPVDASEMILDLSGDGAAQVTVWARGAPVGAALRERSLVWTDPALLDDREAVSVARVLAAASSDGHGGVLLDRWFRRFATTVHSERAAPAQLMDEIAGTQGPDPSQWDLDALPFVVTGVHNRLDLAPREGDCGQLRVSVASTHSVIAPLHMIFLFRQVAAGDDAAPDGDVHCLGAARRWARLAELDDTMFVAAARALIDETLVRERFLLAETVELTVSPWEWRQWTPVGDDELDNPPLFQTVNVPALNAAGALRDDFIAFVTDNAEALSARTLELPSKFRSASAQAPPSVPAEPLDLSAVPAGVLDEYPDLAPSIEMVGCPKCHTDNAEFVQTSVDRKFSPFYDLELEARAKRLDLMNAGDEVPVPPFGPLQ